MIKFAKQCCPGMDSDFYFRQEEGLWVLECEGADAITGFTYCPFCAKKLEVEESDD